MLTDFKYYRQALGIQMLWNSYPFIFFIRDGLRLGPSGSVFTILFWSLGFLLIWPKNIFSTIYLSNKILSFFWLFFIGIAWVYWMYYPSINGSPSGSRETLTYILPLGFFILLSYYPNDKAEVLLKTLIIYTLIASCGLLYIILNDPTWTIGERAGIRYAANTAQSNPHTFANNALMTIVASTIMMQKTRHFLHKIIYIFLIIFSLVVIILCRTNTSIITLVVIAFIAFLFNTTSVIKTMFSKNTIKIVVSLLLIFSIALSRFQFVTNAVASNFQAFSARFEKVIYTVTGIETSTTTASQIDHSSLYRVLSWKYATDFFFNQASLGTILFGEGYKAKFFDVPSLEAWINLGILGFIFYNGFWILFGISNLIQYAIPTNPVSTFVAYFSLLLFVSMFSGGQVIDISAWLTQAFLIRFSSLKLSPNLLQTT